MNQRSGTAPEPVPSPEPQAAESDQSSTEDSSPSRQRMCGTALLRLLAEKTPPEMREEMLKLL